MYRVVKTPLQRDIDFVIRVLVVLVSIMGSLLAASFLVRSVPLVDSVKASAVVVGLVPQGLFMMIAVSYAIGAVRMAGKGALIQQANAIESMSNVDVVCLDKTGTLTTNNLRLDATEPIGISQEELKRYSGRLCGQHCQHQPHHGSHSHYDEGNSEAHLRRSAILLGSQVERALIR